MKRIALTVALTALASSAFAGSDRYNYLRLDTSKPPASVASVTPDAPALSFVVSTKGEKIPYAYLNPHGVGPNNDSR